VGRKNPKWVEDLLLWYLENKRDLPWRRTNDPYRIWVSEVMLQQTQVDTVIPYYQRFLKKYRSIKALAKAKEDELLKVWEGLGYYSRALNMKVAASEMVESNSGRMPSRYERLIALKGIGPYIAAAVSSIAFGEPRPVVDGNVLRVFSRFWGVSDDVMKQKTRQGFVDRLTVNIERENPSDFNQAVMELGALICSPKKPNCAICPIRRNCFARKNSRQVDYPVKIKKGKVPHYNIAIGIIQKRGRYLIAKRKPGQLLGGLWEFPGGKIKEDETRESALKREIKEETNLTVGVGEVCATVNHAYSHFKVTLHAYHCSVKSGRAKPNSAEELRWIRPSDMKDYPFPGANRKILEKLQLCG